MTAFLNGDRETVKGLCVPHPELDLLFNVPLLTTKQREFILAAMKDEPHRVLKSGETATYPSGYKVKVDGDWEKSGTALVVSKSDPIPHRLRRIGGEWKVDPEDFIEMRKQGQRQNSATDDRPEPAAETDRQPGHYSYDLPLGWKFMTLPTFRNPIATDPKQVASSPYIQVDEVTSTTSLADFTAANKEQMKKMVPSTVFIDEKPFVTAAGKKGVRIIVTCHVGKDDRKAIYFLLEGPNKVTFVILCNTLASSFDQNEPIFDAAMKSFVCE